MRVAVQGGRLGLPLARPVSVEVRLWRSWFWHRSKSGHSLLPCVVWRLEFFGSTGFEVRRLGEAVRLRVRLGRLRRRVGDAGCITRVVRFG